MTTDAIEFSETALPDGKTLIRGVLTPHEWSIDGMMRVHEKPAFEKTVPIPTSRLAGVGMDMRQAVRRKIARRLIDLLVKS